VDAVVVEAVRSPICRTPGGALRGIAAMELVHQTVEALLARAGIDPADVDRLLIQYGNTVNDELAARTYFTWPVNQLPTHIPAMTMDRWCGTGQEAMHKAARSIAGGSSDIFVVVGVEPAHPHIAEVGDAGSAALKSNHNVPAALQRVMAAELLTAKWGISRRALDEYAVRSHQRAAEVAVSGDFNKEIVPIYAPNDGTESGRLAVCDEPLARDITVEQLRAL
jgi:acetyl-CoA acyltransferase